MLNSIKVNYVFAYLVVLVINIFCVRSFAAVIQGGAFPCSELEDSPYSYLAPEYNRLNSLYHINQCALVTPSFPNSDISSTINSFPRNTLIFLTTFSDVSEFSSTSSLSNSIIEPTPGQSPATSTIQGSPTPTPSAITVNATQPPVEPTQAPRVDPCELLDEPGVFCSASIIRMKPGQLLVGVLPDSDDKVVFKSAPRVSDSVHFEGGHMLEVGRGNEFPFQQTNLITGVHFLPSQDNDTRSIDSIIFSACFNGTLTIDDNEFELDTRAAVYSYCGHSNPDTSIAPHISFTNNRIEGSQGVTPREGFYFSMPRVRGVAGLVSVTGNTFACSMHSAIEMTLAADSTGFIGNNSIEHPAIDQGLYLKSAGVSSSDRNPTYELSENTINVLSDDTHNDAIVFEGNMNLHLADNQIDGFRALVQLPNSDGQYEPLDFGANSNGNQSTHHAPCAELHRYRGLVDFGLVQCRGEEEMSSPESSPTPDSSHSSGTGYSHSTGIAIALTLMGLLVKSL